MTGPEIVAALEEAAGDPAGLARRAAAAAAYFERSTFGEGTRHWADMLQAL
jgi:hypothetical protein